MLLNFNAEPLMDDSVEAKQILRERLSLRSRPMVIPTTIVKTYVRDNIRYWEERTPSGIIVSISSREIK